MYQNILPGIIRRFNPDMILVSAGYDIHVNDPHANIRVSHEGISAIVQSILHCSATCPAVFVLEGGYELLSLGESLITVEEMVKQ